MMSLTALLKASRRGVTLGLALSLATGAAWAQATPSDVVAPDWTARVKRAERFLPAALAPALAGIPTQKRYGSGGRPILDPLVVPVWTPGGEGFYYWGPDHALWRVEPLSGGRQRVTDAQTVAALLSTAGAPAAGTIVPEVKLIDGAPVLDLALDGGAWRVDVATSTARRLPRERPLSIEARSPDGQAAALVRNHDLYVRSVDGVERRITDDAEGWYSFDPRYARSNPVSPSKEPAGAPNVTWLPGPGHRLLIERWDFRKVGPVWMIDAQASPRPALVEQRMAAPGDAEIPRPEFWIVDADTGSSRRVEAGDWAYLGNMDVGGGGFFPSPDGKTLLFTRMSRDYGVLELVELTLGDGAQRVVLREPDPRGVRAPQATFIENGRAILWKSTRGGRLQFWRIDLKTGAARQVTRGDFTAERILYVDEKAGRLYFTAFGDGAGGDPYYPHSWVAELRTGKARRLDDADTAQVAVVSPDGRYLVETSSRVDRAPRAVVRGLDGKVLMDLGAADVTALVATGWRAPERVHAKGADGKTDIYGVMWTPSDFDPRKRYPVVVQVYPGPTYEKHPVGFAADNSNAALAELGFVVVHLGQRGSSPVRDRAYADYARTQGSVRDYPLADNRAALIALGKTRPYMDLDRVGIIGESGGGFMTVSAMLAYPEVYKVGVAAAGNYDNTIYEMNSSEFFWGTPGAPGSAAYDVVQAEAGKLSGALMIVHGDLDEDVALASSSRLMAALNRAGKRYETLILPGFGHFDFDAQTRTYYRLRLWRFLIDNLKPEPGS